MSDYPVGVVAFFVCVGGVGGGRVDDVGCCVVVLCCVVGRHGYCILWGKKRLCYDFYSLIKFIRSRCR